MYSLLKWPRGQGGTYEGGHKTEGCNDDSVAGVEQALEEEGQRNG